MDTSLSDSEALSTDQDQDDSLNMSVSSNDDLNMNDEEMRQFDVNAPRVRPKNLLFQESTAQDQNQNFTKHDQNMSSRLQNPSSLISDFYISNMNYAMRYSVEYVQQVAKDLRTRRQRQDSMNCANQSMVGRTVGRRPVESVCANVEDGMMKKVHRSSSVDRLYAVRREHIRYANGADEYFGARNISFTTDDIQDIYMPSAIDNYKRKIAVELERRRRNAEHGYKFH